MFFYSITLLHQGPLQYHPSLLVPEVHLDHYHLLHVHHHLPLVVLCSKLVHPAQLGITVLAEHVSDHVAPCEHDPVHDLTVVQVDHLVEQEGPARGPCEPGGDELPPVG